MNEITQAPDRSFWERHFWRIFIWFGVAVVVAFFLFTLQPATSHAPNAVRRLQSSNNLRDIGLALHSYHDTYGSFPPAYVVNSGGEPLYSWRVLVLPFVDGGAEVYEEFHLDEPWSSQHNRTLLAKMPEVYQSPYLPREEQSNGMTPIRGIVDEHKWRTILRPRSGIKLDEIPDGADNTGLAIGDPAHMVEWTKPEDIDPLALLVLNGLDQTKLKGVLVVQGDGAVRFFDQDNWRDLIGLIYDDDGRVPEVKP